MTQQGPVDPWSWALAVLPIVLLVYLVLRSSWPTATQSLVAAASSLVIGAARFGAGPEVLAVGTAKGVWTGIWILYVIWPALLLYHVARHAGLDRMGEVFANVLPRDVENVLLVAWVLPSFIQGVAGFGTPIAIAAPLLISMRVRPALAVALPLIGYHWSVTFGSMGSSFYMGALTAGLDLTEQTSYARYSALLLGVNMMIAGVLVCLMHGGMGSLKEAWRMLLISGCAMLLALQLSVRLEPSVGSLSAGAAGLVSVSLLRLLSKRRLIGGSRPPLATSTGNGGVDDGDRPARQATTGDKKSARAAFPTAKRSWSLNRSVIVLLPYAYLLAIVIAVFLPKGSREFAKTHFLVGPSFPATATSFGVTNDPVSTFTPIAVLGHPGSFLLLSAVLGYFTYRRTGLWRASDSRATLQDWLLHARRSSLPVIALAALAAIMVDTGMVQTIASGAAMVTGTGFPAVSPIIGALGSFTTGSTTTSNALFSALQNDVAHLIGISPAVLLAAQTSGGNVGNSLAPVVMIVGITAAGSSTPIGSVLRLVLGPAAVLMTVLMLSTLTLAVLV